MKTSFKNIGKAAWLALKSLGRYLIWMLCIVFLYGVGAWVFLDHFILYQIAFIALLLVYILYDSFKDNLDELSKEDDYEG